MLYKWQYEKKKKKGISYFNVTTTTLKVNYVVLHFTHYNQMLDNGKKASFLF